ncbi:MAG: VOC family protein [Polymorphobacter sp.]|jgi:2,3-dihydroxybiphenyl 1,2-dioxygenase
MSVVGLGYLGLNVPDVDAWVRFACGAIGLDQVQPPPSEPWLADAQQWKDGSAFFRVDDWTWRLALHPAEEGGEPGLAYLGLEVPGRAALENALARLADAGHETRRGSVEECRRRAVTDIGFTRDPGGHVVELFYGPQKDHGYQNKSGMRFITGEMGMGHINLFASNYAASRDFYCDVLGFRLTDYYAVGPGQSVNFFHVNPRHHSIGLMEVAPFDAIHHLMLEVSELDMVGLAYDRVRSAGCKITASLGRHSNDRIVSFYVESPSGVEVEIGWGAITVGPDWTPSYRAPGDVWGHHGLTADAIAEAGEGRRAPEPGNPV